MSQRKGAKEEKEKFIVFISIDLVNLTLEQQYGKSWWPELIIGLVCVGSHHCILLWRVEFQFQVWSTAWVSTSSKTQKKPTSTKSNLKCFLIDFVSFTQASPRNPPVSASFLLRLQVWVAIKVDILLSGSQMRDLGKVTMWTYLNMLKSFFCEPVYGRQYYQGSRLWGLHG